MVLLLEDEGHEVAEAGDGVEALEVIDRGWVPEVVLTDVRCYDSTASPSSTSSTVGS
ncbi:MAG: hypothetical protein IPK80_00760 [Nannocystis sp.]|nr:hypothetical protein [Nannocystis sp.]